MTKYDIILAGAGLSGLAMALEIARRPAFRQKKVLLLDRDSKGRNDRTWCFWAADGEPLPPVVHHSWSHCRFFGPGFQNTLDIAPYRYHMVRGIDFYNWAKKTLALHPQVEQVQTDIQKIEPQTGIVRTASGDFMAPLVFNSAFTKTALLPPPIDPYAHSPFSVDPAARTPGVLLLQHFKGWVVRAPAPAFDPAAMTFMDFRIPQEGQTRFVYVLPFSPARALVEFTLFSPALLPGEAYESGLRDYLHNSLNVKDFEIEEQEFGVIPMTDFPFPRRLEGKVLHIGTAGGFVKASSGYAFLRTLRKTRAFVDAWERDGRPDPVYLQSPRLFRLLDAVFLQVLADRNELGAAIFTSLFQKLPPAMVLRFLDEDATFAETLRLLGAPPARPFLQALWKQLPRLNRI